MQPCQNENKSFFEKLQNTEDLDLRDKRGKRHDLAVVLVGVTIALLSNRDGNLSSIHRHLSNHHERLTKVLGIAVSRPVSRSQLPLILEKVAVEIFDRLLFETFGARLTGAEKQWFAVDGKELRGSILSGEKRGEAVVQAVNHQSRRSAGQVYYSGEKESEVPVVRSLLENNRLSNQKVSLDALHCKPDTLKLIAQQSGKYVVGLKDNQKQLARQIRSAIENQANLFSSSAVEKGHGRIEQRGYRFYDILELETDARWEGCQLKTVIEVRRETEEVKSGKRSRETSFYLSNVVGSYEELCGAVRNHWQVETNNHIRDVSLKEDQLRSKKRCCSE